MHETMYNTKLMFTAMHLYNRELHCRQILFNIGKQYVQAGCVVCKPVVDAKGPFKKALSNDQEHRVSKADNLRMLVANAAVPGHFYIL